MGQENGFDIEHLRELYEKELNAENMSSEEEVKKESGDQGRFGEKKANLASENTSVAANQGSFGQKKTQTFEDKSWTCPACETVNTGNFCSVCGEKRPDAEKEMHEREQRDAEEQAHQTRELREEAEHEKQAHKGKSKKPLIIGLCATAALLVLFLAIRGGIQKNAVVQPTPELGQVQAPIPEEAPVQETRIRTITQNYDENTAVTATLNSSDVDNRLVIELIDRSSGMTFSEYKISVDGEDRVQRIEHYVEGALKTTRWLEYESGQLASYVIELNNQSHDGIGGLGGESCVLSNTEGDLWLWGGPGAPEPFDTTAWEDIDWSSTAIMDSFDMYSLCLYSPDPYIHDLYYSVFAGNVYVSSEGFISELHLFDLNYSDGLTDHGYDSSLTYMVTYEYDENQSAWVSHYDENWEQFVDIHEETTQDLDHIGTDAAALAEDWNNASKYIAVDGVNQAVFLDDSGRTVRLLLRSLGREEVCADYRLEWNNGQIAAISRLDINGNLLIRHEFIYENGIFVSDAITSDLEIWYEDYEPWTDDYWADPVYPAADKYGQRIVGLPDKEHGSREILIFSDGIEYENPGLYVEYESFRLIVCDTDGQLGVVFNFNMDGTSNGYSADKLYDENWNEIG